MFINLGSFLAPFTAGLVADKFFAIKSISGEIIHYGYKPMFFICSIIGITWTITFLCLAPKYLKDTGKSPYYLYKAEQKSIFSFDFTDNEKKRIKAMGIISIFVILFWTSFYQSFSSITLYARDHVDRNLLGFIIPVPWFAALNAILGILFAPILALVWNQLRKRNVTIPVKISLGIFSMGTAFAFMTISVLTSGDMKANMIFIVFAYVFNTISELCIAPIGIAMFNCLSPKRYSTFFMGLWYMTMFIASIISGKVAGFTQDMGFLTIFFSLSVILFIMGSVLYLSRKTLDNLMVVEDDCDCRII
jgi:POT family proton-dependent oligopeptide transporter